MVGASLACALAGAPLRVALVEAVPVRSDQQPSYDDRGLALALASQRIYAAVGVWPKLQPEATPIRRIHVSDRGHFGFSRLDADLVGVVALGHVVVARQLGEVLLAHLAGQDNVDVVCPASLETVRLHAELVEATVAEGAHRRTVTTRLLIAADGGRSPVRQHLGVETDERDYGQTAIVANVTPERSHDNTAFERFTKDGPLALLPLTGQRCVAVSVVRTEDVASWLAMDDASFLSELTIRSGRRLGRFVQVGTRRSYPLKLVVARKNVGPRYAVIGNAAHTLHPNAAQGLNLGLRGAAALAERLVQACRIGMDPGGPDVLRAYDDARRQDQCRVIRFSDGLARLFYNDFFPLVIARNLAMLAIDVVPPLKRELMRRAMGIAGPQPRLVRGVPL